MNIPRRSDCALLDKGSGQFASGKEKAVRCSQAPALQASTPTAPRSLGMMLHGNGTCSRQRGPERSHLEREQQAVDVGHRWPSLRGSLSAAGPRHSMQANRHLPGTQAGRMVIGHASGPDKRIHCRFTGRVVVASTELSDDPWVSDSPGALEIVDGEVLKVTPSDRELLVERR